MAIFGKSAAQWRVTLAIYAMLGEGISHVAPAMDFTSLTDSINGFLYHREYKKLTPADKKLAQIWTLNFIRRNNPNWTEEQVQQHYTDLIKIRAYAVDEWGRRML